MVNDPRNDKVSTLIASATNCAPVAVAETSGCSGGCIHRAEVVQLTDGRRFFVKSNHRSAEMFSAEADGLEALRKVGALRVPQVIAQGKLSEHEDCLILELIETGPQKPGFFEQFGVAFAAMHRKSQADQFGWPENNYLGSTRQFNSFDQDWVHFFAKSRLEPQLQMARNQGLGSGQLFRLGEELLSKLDSLIGTPEERPCLLHGDLWSGNFLSDVSGNPVIFDPAVYFGRREADLAMPLLFGGFSSDFLAAYRESWPLADGWQDRLEIYKLYHLLNHLNLFGSGYLDSCLAILRRFA